ncbi:MAG: hypothetical protein ACKKMW_01545 [Candidatus Nealsonbacteria bacterium]
MISTWERKFNKKRPKGMPKWKWHERLKKEEILEKELSCQEKEQFSELNKFLNEEKKKKLRKAPIAFLGNSFITFFILAPITVLIFVLIAAFIPRPLIIIFCLIALASAVWAIHHRRPSP